MGSGTLGVEGNARRTQHKGNLSGEVCANQSFNQRAVGLLWCTCSGMPLKFSRQPPAKRSRRVCGVNRSESTATPPEVIAEQNDRKRRSQGPQWTTSQWDDVAFGTPKCQQKRRVRHSGVQWFLRGVRGVRVDPASQKTSGVECHVVPGCSNGCLMQARLREVPEASVPTDQTLFVRISTVPKTILEAPSCTNKRRSTTWTWLCGARTQRRRHQPRERFMNSSHAS